MANNVCKCNALMLPHVHDGSGIRVATDAENKASTSEQKPERKFSPIS